MTQEGSAAPNIKLLNQDGDTVALSSFKGRKVLIYFYPKADTPGCTTQSCALRDIAEEIGDTVIIGISPDAPAKLKKFDDKYSLGFTLLSDEDHAVAEQFGVWVEKSMYGRSTWVFSGHHSSSTRRGALNVRGRRSARKTPLPSC